MKFSEMVDQASEFLRRRERVSYRALKREFDLDDESLEDLKAELIDAQVTAQMDHDLQLWEFVRVVVPSAPGQIGKILNFRYLR